MYRSRIVDTVQGEAYGYQASEEATYPDPSPELQLLGK